MEREQSLEQIEQPKQQRFMSPLTPDQETLWQSICQTGRETGMQIEDQMINIWTDDTIPTVFRDRALLSVIGERQIQNQLWEGPRAMNLGFALSIKDIQSLEKSRPLFDAQRFADWLDDAQQYAQDTGESVLVQAQVFNWLTELFERGVINEDAFESRIEQIDPQQARPWVYDHTDDAGWGPPYCLARVETPFPVIAHLLNPGTRLAAQSKTKLWGLRKLDDWIQHQTDPGVELPSWLQTATREQGFELFRQLAIHRTRKEAPYIDWDLLRKGIAMFGTEILYHNEREAWDVVNKYENHSVRSQIVTEILGKRAVARANLEEATQVRPLTLFQLVDATLSLNNNATEIDTLKLLTYEQTVAMDDYINRQEKLQERLQAHRERFAADPKIGQQQAAREHYDTILDSVRDQR